MPECRVCGKSTLPLIGMMPDGHPLVNGICRSCSRKPTGDASVAGSTSAKMAEGLPNSPQERYPALMVLASIYRALAILASIIAICGVVAGLAAMSKDMFAGVAAAMLSLLSGAVSVVTLLAISEGIRLLLDVASDIRTSRDLLSNREDARTGSSG